MTINVKECSKSYANECPLVLTTSKVSNIGQSKNLKHDMTFAIKASLVLQGAKICKALHLCSHDIYNAKFWLELTQETGK